jgi:glycosyltransferase involved in cell wall biosynthesis
VPRVTAILRAFHPDVVNAHFVPNYGWLAVRARARPLVITTLGSDVLVVPRRSPLHAWRSRYVFRHAAAVTSDAAMLTEAIRTFGVPAPRILTVPFGIEASRRAALAAAGARRAAAPLVVLWTRRLEPVYDVATLLRAWERLDAPARRAMELRVAGGGSQEAALRARGAVRGASFLGWLAVADLDRQLAAAHVYVSASRSDSTSVSLLEAMAAGCLPIVSDIPANREWIEDGATGLLFPCGDDAALADCLLRAARDPDLRTRAARRNADVIAARATWETNMEQVEGLFSRLAPGG